MLSDARPLIVTSLSPVLSRSAPDGTDHGLAYQTRCVERWLAAGAQVVSVNNADEIQRLTPLYPQVRFEPLKTAAPNGARVHLPEISELLRVGKELSPEDCFALVNSDIEYLGNAGTLRALFEEARGGVVYGNRHERAFNEAEPSLPYLYGYDVFIMDSRVVDPGEMDGFRIGVPWWDYLLLYEMAARGVRLAFVGSPIFAHLTHDQKWDGGSWRVGLSMVAARLRRKASMEGAVAGLFAHFCRSLDYNALPAYLMQEYREPVGVVLGTSMVTFVRERCDRVLWTEEDPRSGTVRLRSTPFSSHHDALGDAPLVGA